MAEAVLARAASLSAVSSTSGTSTSITRVATTTSQNRGQPRRCRPEPRCRPVSCPLSFAAASTAHRCLLGFAPCRRKECLALVQTADSGPPSAASCGGPPTEGLRGARFPSRAKAGQAAFPSAASVGRVAGGPYCRLSFARRPAPGTPTHRIQPPMMSSQCSVDLSSSKGRLPTARRRSVASRCRYADLASSASTYWKLTTEPGRGWVIRSRSAKMTVAITR